MPLYSPTVICVDCVVHDLFQHLATTHFNFTLFVFKCCRHRQHNQWKSPREKAGKKIKIS